MNKAETYKLPKILSIALFTILLAGCGQGRGSSSGETDSDSMEVVVDTVPQRVPQPGDEDYKFEDPEAVKEYLDTASKSYAGGILPVIADEVPEYAEKLIASQHDKFLVVDKASMRVILYDSFGHTIKAYDMACAKNYGTKHKKADSRTPEGFFSVEGIYNSTDWLYTDDNGVQSKKKGQFGPRFIRIKIPNTSQIGIHGTCSPWSIGHRASHGCIRITNENILELVELVEPGMPVIVLPGKRDRAVNREEGYSIPYFPTAPDYEMAAAERGLKTKSRQEVEERERQKALEDSLKKAAEEAEKAELENAVPANEPEPAEQQETGTTETEEQYF